MEAQRESFIFHMEYIEDVPQELEAQYAMYVINYALKGIEPQFEDWRDQKMWNGIKTRIDSEREQYEATVKSRAEAGKKHTGNQYTRAKQNQETSSTETTQDENGTKWNKMEQSGTKWNKTEQMELYMNLIMNLNLNLRLRVNLMHQRCR